MAKDLLQQLSKRERQIMDIIYKRGSATAAEVQTDINENINYSTVRALLKILERKGHLRHETQGQKYVYIPELAKKSALNNAVSNLMETFFNNSVEHAVQALLDFDKSRLTDKDFERISKIIEDSRKEQ